MSQNFCQRTDTESMRTRCGMTARGWRRRAAPPAAQAPTVVTDAFCAEDGWAVRRQDPRAVMPQRSLRGCDADATGEYERGNQHRLIARTCHRPLREAVSRVAHRTGRLCCGAERRLGRWRPANRAGRLSRDHRPGAAARSVGFDAPDNRPLAAPSLCQAIVAGVGTRQCAASRCDRSFTAGAS